MNKAKIYPWIFAVVFVLFVIIPNGVASNEELLWTHEFNDASWVSISSNGNYVAIVGNYDLWLFNNEGKMLWTFSLRNHSYVFPDGVVVSQDGRVATVVATSDERDWHNHILFFNRDGKLLRKVVKSSGYGHMDILVSTDGNYVVVNDELRIFCFNKNGREIWHKGHRDDGDAVPFRSIAISADGNYVRADEADNDSSYFYINNGERLHNEPKYCKWIYEETVSLDNAYKVEIHGDKILFFANLTTILNLITYADSVIEKEKSKGFVVAEAESLLSQAENAFSSKNYVKAKELADKSYSLATDIDQDGVTNDEDFAPTIKNIYIYAGTPFALLVLAALTKVSLDVRKRRKIKVRIQKEDKRTQG